MTVDTLAAALADRYRIERKLGQGGMATVYLAADLKHDRKVAIKVLREDVAESLGRSRFLREIRLAAGLNHPHILPLYDSGEARAPETELGGGPESFLYFVMPVVTGQTLRDRLSLPALMPIDEAVRIALEIADALDYAHRHDVVHRDIKPENILLHEGHAIVADFGIGKALVAASQETGGTTQVGVTVGTPAYMSPEQAAGEAVDGRSDLFALGCVLYEMVTGERAFTGATAQAVIAKRFTHTPHRVTELRAGIPESVSSMVACLLARAPEERPATGAHVVGALRSGEVLVEATPRDDKSLAVLPFINGNADAENEFFADGLTEELITDLARVRALRVISRTSSMQFKATTKGIRTIGRELGVRYVLEGSVRRAGNSLRITAQLIDAANDAPLWGDKYTGTADDVFDLQERVSRSIVSALDLTLSPQDEKRLIARPIATARAFEFYLQARQAIQRYQLERGAAFLEQAIAIEGNVPALRALRAYSWLAQVRMGERREGPLALAEAEASKLIELAPDAPYGYALRGFAGYERGDLSQAVRSFNASLTRDPTDAEVLFYLGISYQAACRNAEAAATRERLMAGDPLSPFTELLAGANDWFIGRAAEGVAHLEQGVALDPESVISQWALGYNYALAGRLSEAVERGEWMQRRAPQLPYTAQLRALAGACQGRQAEALEWLHQVDESPLDGHHTFHLSESYAMAGDTAHALELLERAIEHGFYPYDFFAVHCPFMAPLRRTPEWPRILGRAAQRVAEFSA